MDVSRRDEKAGGTARKGFIGSKRFPEDHPESKYKWGHGKTIPQYQNHESQV